MKYTDRRISRVPSIIKEIIMESDLYLMPTRRFTIGFTSHFPVLDAVLWWLTDVQCCNSHLEVDTGQVEGIRPIGSKKDVFNDNIIIIFSYREFITEKVPSWFNYKERIVTK